MTSESNNEAQEALKQGIKALQTNCMNTYHIIENTPPDEYPCSPEEVSDRINNYIEGLRAEVENSTTAIIPNESLLTSQFLNEMKEKTGQIDELIAFTKGNIHDVDAEINRLQSLIKLGKEVRDKPHTGTREVLPAHITKAKEKFQTVKSLLRVVLEAQFPHCSEPIIAILRKLMIMKLDNSSDYIQLDADNYHVVEILRDMNIVTTNPYNNMEIRMI